MNRPHQLPLYLPPRPTDEMLRERLADAVESLNARGDEHPEVVVELKRRVDQLRAALAHAREETRCE